MLKVLLNMYTTHLNQTKYEMKKVFEETLITSDLFFLQFFSIA